MRYIIFCIISIFCSCSNQFISKYNNRPLCDVVPISLYTCLVICTGESAQIASKIEPHGEMIKTSENYMIYSYFINCGDGDKK